MIQWNTSKRDYELASQIAQRAVQLYREVEGNITRTQEADFQRTTLMDIICVHRNDCALRLEELLRAPRFDFSHDVFGIRRHLNRNTGMLEDCFLPRFAVPQDSAAPPASSQAVR